MNIYNLLPCSRSLPLERSQRGTFTAPFQNAERELETFSKSLGDANEVTDELAAWFCEDPSTFDVEECYLVFHTLCQKLSASIQVCLIRRLNLFAVYGDMVSARDQVSILEKSRCD